jgi:1-acyl-sn-glycerol-3-phosphate acyltransferase
MKALDSNGTGAPKDSLRNFLRWLYFPWTWLVFAPYIAVSTIFFGTLAATTCFISKRIAFHCGTAWAFLLCLFNFTWVRVRGRKNIKKGQSYVIMCNHQSHFDVLAFYGHWFYQFRWVMKQELRKVPGLGWGCAGVGHIFIDRSDRQKAIESLEAARPLLAGGISVLFFPEGTRSNDGRLLPFKKGGFMMALQLGLPILPVTISGSRHVLPNRTRKLLPGFIRIQIHEPIDTGNYTIESRDELMAEVRKIIGSGLPVAEKLS